MDLHFTEEQEKFGSELRKWLGAPEDVPGAVLSAVTQPIRVNVEEIVVRPPKQLTL